jgi:hypothetical protein
MPTETIVEQLPRFLSFDDVEAIAVRLGGAEGLTISLSRFRRTRLFGEGALLGLVMLARSQGKEVHIQLGGNLPPFVSSGRNSYWKIFTQSASGFVLGQMADVIYDRAERDVTAMVRREQSRMLKAEDGFIGSGKEVSAPLLDRFGAPAVARVMRESSTANFGNLLAYTLAFRLGVVGEPAGAFSNVAMFASELLENTREHATTDLEEEPIEGVRFLNVRRINPDQENVSQLVPSRLETRSYARAVSEVLALATSAEHLVEITVADCGPGIAARMVGNIEVYEGPVTDERDAVLRAIAKGGSSKSASVTGRGLGLQNVLDATRSLGGLLVFRTGRTRLYYQRDKDTGEDESAIKGVDDPALPYMPGTSVSLLIPWKIRDKQLDLF